MSQQPRDMRPRGVPRPSRIRRTVARLLCLLVLPVALTVGTTGIAEAATHYGDVVQINHGFGADPLGFTGDVMTCSANVYYAIPDGGAFTSIKGVGTCQDAWSVNVNEGDSSVRVDFRGVLQGTSTACTVTGMSDGLSGWALTITATNIGGLCDVTQACWSAEIHLHLQPDLDYQDQCDDVSLGPIPTYAPLASCSYGNITSATVDVDLPNDRWRVHVTWAASPSPSSGNQWGVRVYLSGRTALTPRWGYEFSNTVTGGSAYSSWSTWGGLGSAYTPGAVSILPYGWTPSPESPLGSLAIMGGSPQWGPLDSPVGPKGYTNPAMCTWWYGPKIYDDVTSTFDNPAGTLGGTPDPGNTVDPDPEPPATSGSCNFSLFDPTSWLSGGICKLVGIAEGILSAIANLAGRITGPIVDALSHVLDGLAALFVPDPDSWNVDDVMDQVQEKPPFSIAGELADGVTAAANSYASASGCANPFDGFTDDVLTCDDMSAFSGASAARALIGLGLFITTGVGLWGMFSGAFRD